MKVGVTIDATGPWNRIASLQKEREREKIKNYGGMRYSPSVFFCVEKVEFALSPMYTTVNVLEL